jgi:hypothetical protein
MTTGWRRERLGGGEAAGAMGRARPGIAEEEPGDGIGIGHDAPTPGRMGFIDPWIKSGSREGLAFWTTPVVKKRTVLICLRRDRTVPRLKTL